MLSTQRHPLSLTLGIDSRLRTTERGSNTEISATNSRYRTYEGVAPLASPRRAHCRRRAGCLQPENSGPFVLATALTFLDPCSPGSSLLCSGNRIPSNHQSITRSSALSLRTGPPRPLVHLATASPCSEKKMGLEVRDMRRCPCLCTAPLGCRSRPAANARGYAKADSCPPPAAIDCAARYQRGSAVLPLTVQPVTVHVVERPEPAYTRSHVAKLRQG